MSDIFDFTDMIGLFAKEMKSEEEVKKCNRYRQMCVDKVASLRDQDDGGPNGTCHVSSKKSADARNTYKKCKVDNSNSRKEVYVHQLAVIADNRGEQLVACIGDKNTTQTHECAHRCHNPGCFNPDHISIMTREENKEMNFCRAFEINGVKYTTCIHVPQCILVSTPFQLYNN